MAKKTKGSKVKTGGKGAAAKIRTGRGAARTASVPTSRNPPLPPLSSQKKFSVLSDDLNPPIPPIKKGSP